MRKYIVSLCGAALCSIALCGQAVVYNGGFEEGSLSGWTGSPSFSVTNSGARTGSYAAVGDCSLSPHTFISQGVGSSLIAGVEYQFSAWIKLNPSDYSEFMSGDFVPHLRISPISEPAWTSNVVTVVADKTVGDWQQVSISKSFTQEELDAGVFVGVARINLDSAVFFVDDIEVTPPVVQMIAPSDDDVFLDPSEIILSAAVFTNAGKTISHVQFLSNGSVVGTGKRGLDGEWSFPDGASFSILDDGTIMDYRPAGAPMFCMGGEMAGPFGGFSGQFSTWQPAEATGSVSMVFSLSTDDRLDVSMIGDEPLGTRSLSGGVRQSEEEPRLYHFIWTSSNAGTNALSARVVYADAAYSDSAPILCEVDYTGFDLTVIGGTGEGTYTNGAQVVITADEPFDGMVFDQWIGDTQYVASVTSATTTVTMPAQDIELEATYKDIVFMLDVLGGSGEGWYTNGTQVVITADPAPDGMVFYRWIGDTAYMVSVTSATTTVTMPDHDIELEAVFKSLQINAEWIVFEMSMSGSGLNESGGKDGKTPVIQKGSDKALLVINPDMADETNAVLVVLGKKEYTQRPAVAVYDPEFGWVSEKEDKNYNITAASYIALLSLQADGFGNAVLVGPLKWTERFDADGLEIEGSRKISASLKGACVNRAGDKYSVGTARFNQMLSVKMTNAATVEDAVKELNAYVTKKTGASGVAIDLLLIMD